MATRASKDYILAQKRKRQHVADYYAANTKELIPQVVRDRAEQHLQRLNREIKEKNDLFEDAVLRIERITEFVQGYLDGEILVPDRGVK